jgi:hypothetical protein
MLLAAGGDVHFTRGVRGLPGSAGLQSPGSATLSRLLRGVFRLCCALALLWCGVVLCAVFVLCPCGIAWLRRG